MCVCLYVSIASPTIESFPAGRKVHLFSILQYRCQRANRLPYGLRTDTFGSDFICIPLSVDVVGEAMFGFLRDRTSTALGIQLSKHGIPIGLRFAGIHHWKQQMSPDGIPSTTAFLLSQPQSEHADDEQLSACG